MDALSEIISKRLPPGILIFDLQDRLLFSNGQALEMLALTDAEADEGVYVPAEISALCSHLREQAEPEAPGVPPMVSCMTAGVDPPCSVRAFFLDTPGSRHIMVLMERIVEKHQVDVEKARAHFNLSKREAEVITLICEGLANREISQKLFISEYTVKDHVKNIMKKMEAGSRNEIISSLR